jgi:hypothetical protein
VTNEETMKHIREKTPLDQVRTVFSGRAARIEQAGAQREPLGPIEMRGMEFEAVDAILAKAIEVGLVRPADKS